MVAESELAERLGLSRPEIRAMRARMQEGAHWVRLPEDRRAVAWSAEGIEALKTALAEKKKEGAGEGSTAAPGDTVPGLDGAGEGSEQGDDVREFYVVRNAMNGRIVFASENAEVKEVAQCVRIRVRDNANFIPGMVLRARFEQPGLFSLVGRCPRFRGRW